MKKNDNIYIYINISIYIYTQLFTQFFLNGILPRNNNMTRSKCQNWELAIATVVTRNDLSVHERKKWPIHCEREVMAENNLLASSNYYTVETSKTSAFQSLWEFQTMTKDLWNVNSKSTNLNHTFSRFIESFSKNSCILFSLIQIDGKYLSFNHRVFHQVFWSLLETSTRLGKL